MNLQQQARTKAVSIGTGTGTALRQQILAAGEKKILHALEDEDLGFIISPPKPC
jgi:hypothetical protein